MKLLTLLLLVSCEMPSYFELHAGASEGELSANNRSFFGIDEETYYLGATVGWHVGARRQESRDIAILRQAALSGHQDHSSPLTLNVGQAAPEEAEEEPELLDPLKGPAETLDDALRVLVWVLTLGVAGFLASKIPFVRNYLGGKK